MCDYTSDIRKVVLAMLNTFDNMERWRRTFSDALIKEVTFPTLDGAATFSPALSAPAFPADFDKAAFERIAKLIFDKSRGWLGQLELHPKLLAERNGEHVDVQWVMLSILRSSQDS